MKTGQPKINSLVHYLNAVNPEQLNDLKSQYPDFKDFLEPGIIMGDDNPNVETEEFKFRLVVAQKGLGTIFATSEALMVSLKQKLKRLNNIQLISQIVTLISGAAILAMVEKDFATIGAIKYIAPILILMGSILTLYAKNNAESFIGNNENLYELSNQLIAYNAEAKTLLSEIDIISKYFSIEKARQVIESANKLAKEMDINHNKAKS